MEANKTFAPPVLSTLLVNIPVLKTCLFEKPDPKRLPVFCLPQAGADSASFKQWEAALPEFVQIVPVTLAGRGMRLNDAPARDFHTLCDTLFDELRQHTGAPFVLLGSSMGGWIAFELTRRFERIGRAPALLVILASPVPDRDKKLPELNDPETAVQDIVDFNPAFSEAAQYPELMELILPTIAADFRMCNAYRPAPHSKVNTPVFGICGQDDTLAPQSSMRNWSLFTQAEMTLHQVHGGHNFHETPNPDLFALLRPQFERISNNNAACHAQS